MRGSPASVGGLALLLFCSAGASGQASEAPFGEGLRAGEPIPEAAFAARLEHHRVPGASVAVVRAGQLDWAKGYGVRQAGGDDAVNESTLFQAASISKPVAAAGALRLVAEGVLGLDEDVNRKLSSWTLPASALTAANPVTLRHLLSHSAGLTGGIGPFGYAEGAPLPTIGQVLEGEKPAYSAAVRLEGEPGKEHRYSAAGYTVLQQLMVDAAGAEFPELMERLVLRPAGMTDSSFEQPLPEGRRSSAASAHLWHGGSVSGSWHSYPEMAVAGLWTTPTDLARFAIELWRSYHGRSETLLPQEMTRRMLTRESGEFGLGLWLPAEGVARFQHGGANYGYRCFMVLSIESGDGIVIMTNGDSGQALMDEVLAAVGEAYGWAG